MRLGNKSLQENLFWVEKQIDAINPQGSTLDLTVDEIQKTDAQRRKRFRRSLWFWSIFGLILGIGGYVLSLPPILTCGSAAKSSEGKHYLGAINRSQSFFWSENNKFAQTLPALQVGISDTDRYSLKIISKATIAYHYAISKKESLNSFIGAVFILPEDSPAFNNNERLNSSEHLTKPFPSSSSNNLGNNFSSSLRQYGQQWNLVPASKQLMPFAILCETKVKGSNPEIDKPFLEKGIPTCGKGTNKIS